MPAALFTAPDRRLNVIRFTPVVSAEDLRRLAETIASGRYDRSFNEIIWYDGVEVQISFQPADLVRFAHYVAAVQSGLPRDLRRRSAIVGGRSDTDAMARAWTAFFPPSQAATTEYRVFPAMEEAMEWIGQSEPFRIAGMDMILDSREGPRRRAAV